MGANVRAIAADRRGNCRRASTASDIAAAGQRLGISGPGRHPATFSLTAAGHFQRPVGRCCSRYYGDYVRRRWRAGRCVQVSCLPGHQLEMPANRRRDGND